MEWINWYWKRYRILLFRGHCIFAGEFESQNFRWHGDAACFCLWFITPQMKFLMETQEEKPNFSGKCTQAWCDIQPRSTVVQPSTGPQSQLSRFALSWAHMELNNLEQLLCISRPYGTVTRTNNSAAFLITTTSSWLPLASVCKMRYPLHGYYNAS